MERAVGAISLLSVVVALFLLPVVYANLDISTNETDYSLGYSEVKIIVASEGEGHKSTRTAAVTGDDGAGVAGIMVTVSESGLNYAKEVLVNEILAEITPLWLPDIKTHIISPIGRVDTQISHIELSGANVSYSDIDLGKTGVTVFAGDIHARIRLHWYYKYTAPYVPFPVNDGGWADVEVCTSCSTLMCVFSFHFCMLLLEKHSELQEESLEIIKIVFLERIVISPSLYVHDLQSSDLT